MEKAQPSIVVCFGTRPEVIKLAPVLAELRDRLPGARVTALSTGQQSALLDQTLRSFDIRPDISLAWNGHGRSLGFSLSHIVRGVSEALEELDPDLVVVQGDTLSTYGAALAAFYAGRRLVHVEAGLRTYDLQQPFPEELHRQAVARLATLHLAPTEQARRNLRDEGIDDAAIVVTGNTGQDALRLILPRRAPPDIPGLDPTRPYAVATVHRRENVVRVEDIARGLRDGAVRSGLPLVVVLHPNPAVSTLLREALAGCPQVCLADSLPMEHMVGLCRAARFLLTDSGGLQEEATALGVPCLVLRGTTDRPESVDCGTARVLGVETNDIAAAYAELATDDALHERMRVAADVYGDGRAAGLVVDAIIAHLREAGALP